MNLPTGITRHQGKYRVRLYLKSRPFHGGYHTTLESALHALQRLKEDIENLPTPEPSIIDFFIYSLPRPNR